MKTCVDIGKRDQQRSECGFQASGLTALRSTISRPRVVPERANPYRNPHVGLLFRYGSLSVTCLSACPSFARAHCVLALYRAAVASIHVERAVSLSIYWERRRWFCRSAPLVALLGAGTRDGAPVPVLLRSSQWAP